MSWRPSSGLAHFLWRRAFWSTRRGEPPSRPPGACSASGAGSIRRRFGSKRQLSSRRVVRGSPRGSVALASQAPAGGDQRPRGVVWGTPGARGAFPALPGATPSSGRSRGPRPTCRSGLLGPAFGGCGGARRDRRRRFWPPRPPTSLRRRPATVSASAPRRSPRRLDPVCHRSRRSRALWYERGGGRKRCGGAQAGESFGVWWQVEPTGKPRAGGFHADPALHGGGGHGSGG